jgi:uncharacterized protein involved in cysteine biosynthesis
MPEIAAGPAARAAGTGVVSALRRAVPVFFSARVVGVFVLPLVLAAAAFIAIGALAWTPLTGWLETAVFAAERDGGGWREIAAAVVAFLVFTLAAVATALATIAVIAMPVIVRVVAERDFTTLERRRGGTFAGSLVNAAVALGVFVPAWLASLVLLLAPPLFIAASLALSAWLNQRLLRYDALAEHASAAEMQAIIRGSRWKLLALGLVLAPLSYVPVVNLLAPLYAGVAFTYLCLGELAAARGATSRASA